MPEEAVAVNDKIVGKKHSHFWALMALFGAVPGALDLAEAVVDAFQTASHECSYVVMNSVDLLSDGRFVVNSEPHDDSYFDVTLFSVLIISIPVIALFSTGICWALDRINTSLRPGSRKIRGYEKVAFVLWVGISFVAGNLFDAAVAHYRPSQCIFDNVEWHKLEP